MTKMTRGSYALITGASKGLGIAFANELAKRDINLLLVSLPNEGLADISRDIAGQYNIHCHYAEADLTQTSEILRIAKWAESHNKLRILINNAGFGCSGVFENIPVDKVDQMILINVRAATLLTHQLLPALKNNGQSFILNVSSMISFSPTGFKSAYPATKVFMESFSRGLNAELRGSGVSVSAVHPGPMHTNAEVSKRIEKQSFFGRLGVLKPETVARVSIEQMFKEKSSIVVGFGNLLHWALMRILPASFVIRITTTGVKRELANAKN